MDQFFQSAIQRILPHRYPFLLVDRVTELVPGQRIVGSKVFTANEDFGNDTGGAQVPSGILMEALTQLGAILVLHRPEMEGRIAVMLQIPAARLLRPVEAGDVVRLEAEVVKLGERFGELRGAAYVEGELVAEGQMRFALARAAEVLPPCAEKSLKK
jgi:3-hydroxymyristoyl/3-hydroxydecanoyl-(acyl carrier protein) dehydratase